MALFSMTGFASAQGQIEDLSWSMDIRSVNAKGLDVRARIPDWLSPFENKAKTHATKALSRGNVSLSLRLSRTESEATALKLCPNTLAATLAALAEVEAAATRSGVTLSAPSSADILGMRGVLDQSSPEQDPTPIVEALLTEFKSIFADFVNMRESEGRMLSQILREQLTKIATLTDEACSRAEARKPLMAEALRGALTRVLDNSDGADPDRIAQELALLAVKADVTEELDRLRAHVGAAEALLDAGGPVGRKLDFLMQEFNREANTLCSKAQNADLTEIGIELKTVIDQMREQVQNIE